MNKGKKGKTNLNVLNLKLYDEEKNNNFNDENLQKRNNIIENSKEEKDNIQNYENEDEFNRDEELSKIDLLSNQLKYLNDMLTEKTTDVEKLKKEKKMLNEQIIKIKEEIIIKDNEIKILKSQLINKDEILTKIKKENENLERKNKELNNKIKLNDNLKEIYFKNKNNNINQNEFLKNEYELKIKYSELQCILEETKEKNSKIEFDNKALKMQIESLKEDKENEMKLFKKVQEKEKERYDQIIGNLNKQINEMNIKINENKINNNIENKSKNKNNNDNLLNQISNYEIKLRLNGEENFNLKKENQKLKKQIGELKIIKEGNEEIIQKINTDYENIINELKDKVSFYEQNYLQMNEKNNTINILNEKNEKLMRENEQFKINYLQINNDAIELNQLFNQKKNEFEIILQNKNQKLKEYKQKIASLKIKINELYNELNNLYNNNDNKILKTFESQSERVKKEKNKIPFNHHSRKNSKDNNIIKKLNTSYHSKNNSSISVNFENNEDNDQLKFLEKYRQTLTKVDEDLKKFGNTLFNK